jgi:hypothetical protein
MKRKAESQTNSHNGKGILKKRAKTGMQQFSPANTYILTFVGNSSLGRGGVEQFP